MASLRPIQVRGASVQRDAIMNTRVLVIDDEEAIRDGFVTILGAGKSKSEAIDAAVSALFGDRPVASSRRRESRIDFQVDLAASGGEGIERVRAAVQADKPYAVVFCDIRMPGIDGVEVIEKIREIDPRVEVVFITAYSDHDIEMIVDGAGANVSYFVKPFVHDEARQLATKLVLDWNKARELEGLMTAVSSLRGDQRDIDRLLAHLLDQTCAWLETESAALFRRMPNGTMRFCLGVGELESERATELVDELGEDAYVGAPTAHLADGTLLLRLADFGLVVALPGRARLTPDRRALLLTFLQHAVLAIRNRETEAELVRNQRFAGIGQAVGYVLHDIRHPLGTTQMVLKLLRSSSEAFESLDEAYDMMEQEVQRALDLVGDILTLCRANIELEPSKVHLRSALERAIHVWNFDLDARKTELVVDIPDALEAYADVPRLERALSNLVKNASDALADAKVRRIEIGATRVEGGARIWVADTGSGVPPQLLARLFEPFATSEKPEGTGFGLAIVKQIVDAHGGRIQVERVGEMTRFEMFLPDAG